MPDIKKLSILKLVLSSLHSNRKLHLPVLGHCASDKETDPMPNATWWQGTTWWRQRKWSFYRPRNSSAFLSISKLPSQRMKTKSLDYFSLIHFSSSSSLEARNEFSLSYTINVYRRRMVSVACWFCCMKFVVICQSVSKLKPIWVVIQLSRLKNCLNNNISNSTHQTTLCKQTFKCFR